ncbi:Ribosomal protein S4, mitochondrial [Sesamum angolense]|uniref:Ribosomal protein S4, mitochondrial n=1 Tax=Sesamum angolense TaxID=2727404 RepID=A0AAE1TCE6_9LAMI|nr:Ribosomal protein S4, mitochondrial [Sesamum angolense]
MWRRTKTEWFRKLKTKKECRLLLKSQFLQQLRSSMQEEDRKKFGSKKGRSVDEASRAQETGKPVIKQSTRSSVKQRRSDTRKRRPSSTNIGPGIKKGKKGKSKYIWHEKEIRFRTRACRERSTLGGRASTVSPGTVECRYHEREVQDTRPRNPGNHSPMCQSLAHPGPRRPAQLERPSLI